jgi:glycosyltransferase involved in cell wall biosynthesis
MNLRLLEAPKKGVSHQRNYGATQTDSPFVFFIDADARLEPDTLQNAHINIDSWKHLVYLPMHVPQESKFDDSAMQSTINFLTEISQITDKPFSYGPSMIFEHNFFTFIDGFNEGVTFFEDHEIVQRARRSGVIAKLLKDVRVQFSMRRFQEEGRFKVLQKYLIATAHMYTKGEITDNLFEYEWGGKRYAQSSKDASLEERFKKHVSQMKTYINTLIEKGNIV